MVPCLSCVKSPQILELSGIGDSKILDPLGIPVKVDLPGVGTNLQEHTTIGLGMYSGSFLSCALCRVSTFVQS